MPAGMIQYEEATGSGLLCPQRMWLFFSRALPGG